MLALFVVLLFYFEIFLWSYACTAVAKHDWSFIPYVLMSCGVIAYMQPIAWKAFIYILFHRRTK